MSLQGYTRTFDYPERFASLYNDIEIPLPKSFYDEGAETTGRSFLGQSMDNLKQRYLDATADPALRKDFMNYPGLPFSVDGLTKRKLATTLIKK